MSLQHFNASDVYIYALWCLKELAKKWLIIRFIIPHIIIRLQIVCMLWIMANRQGRDEKEAFCAVVINVAVVRCVMHLINCEGTSTAVFTAFDLTNRKYQFWCASVLCSRANDLHEYAVHGSCRCIIRLLPGQTSWSADGFLWQLAFEIVIKSPMCQSINPVPGPLALRIKKQSTPESIDPPWNLPQTQFRLC